MVDLLKPQIPRRRARLSRKTAGQKKNAGTALGMTSQRVLAAGPSTGSVWAVEAGPFKTLARLKPWSFIPHPATPDATLTRTGVAMGTAGYVSREQVRGEELDARIRVS